MNNDVTGPIRSKLACDPDYADLVQQFVENLPSRHEEIVAHLAAGDMQKLQRSIHQLRGACGGYGFACLSEMAAGLEERIRAGESIAAISAQVNSFAAALLRVTADPDC